MNLKLKQLKNITYENFTKTILETFLIYNCHTLNCLRKKYIAKFKPSMKKPNPDDYTAQPMALQKIGDKEKHFGNHIITPLFLL